MSNSYSTVTSNSSAGLGISLGVREPTASFKLTDTSSLRVETGTLSGQGRGVGSLDSDKGFLVTNNGNRTSLPLCDTAGETMLESDFFYPAELRQEHGADSPVDSICLPDFTSDGRSEKPGLSRQVTLLEAGTKSSRNTAELKNILGNAHSRLKSGAKLPEPPSETRTAGIDNAISLERASTRSRVDVDIFLENDVCVQGGCLKGSIKIRVRKRLKTMHPILLSGGKIRVIGFESILNEEERCAFYQYSSPLADVTSGLERLYTCAPDEEGFARTSEGVYMFPFTFHLPLSSEQGTPKGCISTQSGVSVRYIAMVSLRLKDSVTGSKSIAHFYRDCSIWPRLNPSVVLAPTWKPLQATASEGESSKIQLTSSLHRPHWVAGQLCHVKIMMVNNSKKPLKTVTLELFRSITTLKPQPHLDSNEIDAGASQSTTTTKKIAESVLVIGNRGTRGHASAKGWWTGVDPGESQTFMHSILLPPDALSIQRGKLLEVSYAIQVVVGTGALLSTDVHVSLPLQIINFISMDPPPTTASPMLSEENVTQMDTRESTTAIRSYGANSQRSPSDLEDESLEFDDDEIEYDGPEEDGEDGEAFSNLPIQEDNDEMVQHAIASAMIDIGCVEDAPRFSDLYYSSLQENLDRAAESFVRKQAREKQSYDDVRSSEMYIPQTDRTERARKSSNFASRVEEKTLERQASIRENFRRSMQAVADLAITLNGTEAENPINCTETGPLRPGSSILTDDRAAAPSSLKSGTPESAVSLEFAGSQLSGRMQSALPNAQFLNNEQSFDRCTGVDIASKDVLNPTTPRTWGAKANMALARTPRHLPASSVDNFVQRKTAPHPKFGSLDRTEPYVRSQKSSESPTVFRRQDLPDTTNISGHSRTALYDQSTEKFNEVQSNRRRARSSPTTPTRRPLAPASMSSTPRSGSVQDKIRELEERLAKASADI